MHSIRILLLSSFLTVLSARGADLLNDDFSAMQPGMISAGVIGALTEYHYLPLTAPKGNWVVSIFRTPASQRAWHVIADDDRHLIQQSYTASGPERVYMHPMLIAGDSLWSDYEVETSFAPEKDDGGLSGVVFRYRNDRRYYFAGVIGQKAILKKVDQGVAFRKLNETVLAESPFAWKPGEFIPVRITATGGKLRAKIANVTLEATDTTLPEGKIGFTSDMPTRFGAVRVTASRNGQRRFETARAKREAEEKRLVAANPKMVVWRKISLNNFGVGRHLRFGDLNGDGRIDILVVQQKRHGPGDGHSEVGCITALNLDGEVMWQSGTADSWNYLLTNDVGVQIGDLDGDGKNEVVFCRDFKIIVLDGATGNMKFEAPTPDLPLDPQRRSRFPKILGDSLFFADLRGLGTRRDIIIKDRYRNIWAYNDRLEQMWTLPLNTGHFGFPYDVDGDRKEELLVGYSLVSPDGKVLWSNEKTVQDHADGVAIVPLKEGAEPMALSASSDEGLFFADMKGNIVKHHHIGHVQNISIADYRPDMPGLETVAINFWGNQGIVHLLNSDGNIYHDFEPAQHGSMLLPVNWTGQAGEFWALSPNSIEGGLFDGWGRRVVRFPADGHPDQCIFSLDVTGDARDELIVWDPWALWIYTQSDSPKSGRLYQPKRNSPGNESNYKAQVSLPGWSN